MAISAYNVNLGTIHPNEIHSLVIPVFNSGTEIGVFEMGVSYFEAQPEHKIPSSWVNFIPKSFTLEPNATQWMNVDVKIKVKKGKGIKNGEYFCFLEACHKGCAAIKLSFTLNK